MKYYRLGWTVLMWSLYSLFFVGCHSSSETDHNQIVLEFEDMGEKEQLDAERDSHGKKADIDKSVNKSVDENQQLDDEEIFENHIENKQLDVDPDFNYLDKDLDFDPSDDAIVEYLGFVNRNHHFMKITNDTYTYIMTDVNFNHLRSKEFTDVVYTGGNGLEKQSIIGYDFFVDTFIREKPKLIFYSDHLINYYDLSMQLDRDRKIMSDTFKEEFTDGQIFNWAVNDESGHIILSDGEGLKLINEWKDEIKLIISDTGRDYEFHYIEDADLISIDTVDDEGLSHGYIYDTLHENLIDMGPYVLKEMNSRNIVYFYEKENSMYCKIYDSFLKELLYEDYLIQDIELNRNKICVGGQSLIYMSDDEKLLLKLDFDTALITTIKSLENSPNRSINIYYADDKSILLCSFEEQVKDYMTYTFEDDLLKPTVIEYEKNIGDWVGFEESYNDNLYWSNEEIQYHVSPKLTMLNIEDPLFAKSLLSDFDVVVKNGNITLERLDTEDEASMLLDNEMVKSYGYELIENFYIEFENDIPSYSVSRWNGDYSEQMMATGVVYDENIQLEITFDIAVIPASMENALTNTLSILNGTVKKPKVDYEWVSDKVVRMSITNMTNDQIYGISPNLYQNETGVYKKGWHLESEELLYNSSIHEQDYIETYSFKKVSGPQEEVVFDYTNNTIVVNEQVKNYYGRYGRKSDNLMAVEFYESWIYPCYVYSFETDEFYSYGRLPNSYSNFFEYNNELYLGYENLMKFFADGTSEEVEIQLAEGKDFILSFTKHPTKNKFVSLQRESNWNSDFSLAVYDSEFNLIIENSIDYTAFGFYSKMVEVYWIDENQIITVSTIDNNPKGECRSRVYNIETGEIVNDFKDKIVTVSPSGEYIVLRNMFGKKEYWNSDNKVQHFIVLDKDYDEVMSISTDEHISVRETQYYDFWYENILYIKYANYDRLMKIDMNTMEISYLEFPWVDYVITNVIGEDVFEIITNAKYMRRSYPAA